MTSAERPRRCTLIALLAVTGWAGFLWQSWSGEPESTGTRVDDTFASSRPPAEVDPRESPPKRVPLASSPRPTLSPAATSRVELPWIQPDTLPAYDPPLVPGEDELRAYREEQELLLETGLADLESSMRENGFKEDEIDAELQMFRSSAEALDTFPLQFLDRTPEELTEEQVLDHAEAGIPEEDVEAILEANYLIESGEEEILAR